MLREAIDKQLVYLSNEKEENENSVPKGFKAFVMSDKYYEFLHSLLEYCRELFRLENK